MNRTETISATTIVLLLSALACRPVVAIGWTELAIILLILIVLFAPFLFRLFRFFSRNRRTVDDEKD